MATKTNTPGLFSRIVKGLRSPAPGRVGESESLQPIDSSLETLALSDRIESRRKDDMIRRREFGYLRKVRAQSPRGLASILPRQPLFANSSSFIPEDQSPQDRARTVKKIDAIEAHMAQLWAQKRLQGIVPDRPLAVTSPAAPVPPTSPTSDVQMARSETVPDAAGPSMELDFTASHAFEPEEVTQPADLSPTRVPQAPPVAVPKPPAPEAPAKVHSVDGHRSEFSNSLLTSVELGDDLDNPALHEAAIRFADGDDTGAEAALLSVMQTADASAEVADACTTALLDLYRATDQAASFEEVAIEYAERFGRSAPEWFSVPDRLRRLTAPSVFASLAPSGNPAVNHWDCPAELTVPAVQTLRTSQTSTKARHVHWQALQTIQAEAAAALHALFEEWAGMPLDLHFSDTQVLDAVLQAATPVDNSETAPLWWRLRLEALRIQGRHDDFETAALDYCIVYEVSPPSWQEADCTYVDETHASTAIDRPDYPDTVFPKLDDMVMPSGTPQELRGEVLGDAEQALGELHAHVVPGGSLVISLANVIRVDFSAAASILNWLSTHQGETGLVQFVQVPRLVAAFFQVMGITGVARVSLVKNG